MNDLNKLLKVSKTVFLNSINQLLYPVFQFFLSWWIIQYHSITVWAAFVPWILFFGIGTQVTSFGSKEYLLKLFSEEPAKICLRWQESLVQRMILPILYAVIGLFFFNDNSVDYLLFFGWLFFSFVVKSFESLIVFNKQFSSSIAIELMGYSTFLFFVFDTSFSVHKMLLFYVLSNVLKSVLYVLVYRKYFKGFKLDLSKFSFLIACLPFFIPTIIGLLQSRSHLYLATYYFEEQDLAFYQVYTSFLYASLMLAGFIIIPLSKNMYRLKENALYIINIQMIFIGIIWGFVVSMAIYVILTNFYTFESQLIWVYLLIPVYVTFFFASSFKIYKLYKLNIIGQFSKLLLVLFILSLPINAFLLPNYGVFGAILSAVIFQMITTFIVFRLARLKSV